MMPETAERTGSPAEQEMDVKPEVVQDAHTLPAHIEPVDNLEQFVLKLATNADIRAAYEADAQGTLQQAGLHDVIPEDVNDAITIVSDSADLHGLAGADANAAALGFGGLDLAGGLDAGLIASVDALAGGAVGGVVDAGALTGLGATVGVDATAGVAVDAVAGVAVGAGTSVGATVDGVTGGLGMHGAGEAVAGVTTSVAGTAEAAVNVNAHAHTHLDVLGDVTGHADILGGVTSHAEVLGDVTSHAGVLDGVTGHAGILGGVTDSVVGTVTGATDLADASHGPLDLDLASGLL